MSLNDKEQLRGYAKRQFILDEAERLFAVHGFERTTLRDVSLQLGGKSGITTIQYHFSTKDELFLEVIARRAKTLSQERSLALSSCIKESNGKPTSQEIFAAFISPYITKVFSDDPQWRAYARIVAFIAVDDNRWYESTKEFYDPTARRFIEALQALYPETSEECIARAFLMCVSALLGFVVTDLRGAELSGNAQLNSPERALPFVIQFCVAGFNGALST